MLDTETNIQATGGPRAVKIGETTYLASPIDDRDHATLLDWVKKRLKSPLLAIADDFDKLPPLMQEKAIRAAVEAKTAGGVAPSGEAYREQLLSPAGAAFLAWLSIRHEHQTVKLEDLAKDITADNAVEIVAELAEAAGLGKGIGRNGSAPGKP